MTMMRLSASKIAPLARPAVVIVAGVLALSLYANLEPLLPRAYYRYFPPFLPGYNGNRNGELGGEYYYIATALGSGRGYADPFPEPTGRTAWMPPILTWFEAGLRWLAGGDRETVSLIIVVIQDLTLMGTGFLLLALARKTGAGLWTTTALFFAALIYYFELCFQYTHDCWIVLITLDLLIAGLVWLRPFDSWRAAAGWGVFGGFCALVSPIAGFTWGVLSLASGARRQNRLHLVVAGLLAILTITPWTFRNYLVLGRLVPIKSNLAYELYQSQCLVPGGVLHDPIWRSHPTNGDNAERKEYKRLGEIAFLDHKREQFWQSVQANPADFARRVRNRFVEATLWFAPYNAFDEVRRPWPVRASRVTHPLPFLALLMLLITACWRPLAPAQWIVIGVYLAYLFPYVIISYYERYKLPLVGAEVALMVWGASRARYCFRRRSSAPNVVP
jgi:hypothetical protein